MALFGLSLSAGENRRLGHRSGTRRQDWRRGRRGARTRFRARIDALEERTLLSNVVTVTNDNDSGIGSLRDAINNATSGEIVNFAHSAYGTITLTSGPLQVNEIDLTIQGPGAKKLTISGGGNFTDFILLSPLPPTSPPPASFVPNSVNISGLTIASGNAINNGFGDGGGILSFDALTVSNSVLVNNQAPGDFGSGGAIYSGCCGNASLSLDHDVFARNSVGSSSVTDGIQQGGAIFNADGVATISSSTFTNNQALGYSAQGGAISSNGGTLDVAGTTFLGNQAVGGSSTSGLGGSATGGAIAAFSSVLNLSADTFFGNEALGGSSPMGVQSAIGGAVYSLSGNPFAPNPTSTISNSLFLGNEAIAGIGGGPLALTGGGAIGYSSNTPLNVSNTNFLGNQVVGSRGLSGGAGTEADGGAIWAEGSILTIQGGLIVGNSAVGGRGGDATGGTGGDGGIGGGGGIANLQGSALTITGTTIAGNSAVGGGGGRGSTRGTGGDGLGGGVENDGISVLDDTGNILMWNAAIGGAGGGNGFGGGVYTLGSTTLTDTLVTRNLAIGGTDGGQGVGGGGYIAGGTTILTGQTNVVRNFATTSDDNIYGTSGTSPPGSPPA